MEKTPYRLARLSFIGAGIMKQSILIVLVATSFILFSKTAQGVPCENDTAEMLKCANLEYQEADDKFKDFWQALPGPIRFEYRIFQKNWLEYRENFCTDKANKVAGEEIIRSIIFLKCKTTLTKKRIEYFRRVLD